MARIALHEQTSNWSPNRRGARPAAIHAVAGAFSLAALAFYLSGGQTSIRSRDEHLAVEVARTRVDLPLPDESSDVRFTRDAGEERVLSVDFAVPEEAFRRWAAARGWPVKPVVGSVTIRPRAAFGDLRTVVVVTDGLSYDTLSRGEPNTVGVTYDRGTGRAYYRFDSAPAFGEH